MAKKQTKVAPVVVGPEASQGALEAEALQGKVKPRGKKARQARRRLIRKVAAQLAEQQRLVEEGAKGKRPQDKQGSKFVYRPGTTGKLAPVSPRRERFVTPRMPPISRRVVRVS